MADETDEQILARYRERCGNPYMNLTTARGLRTLHLRYRHLSMAAQERVRLERGAELERIRRKIFGIPDTDTGQMPIEGERLAVDYRASPGEAVVRPISRQPSSKRRS